MGDFFLVVALQSLGVTMGYALVIIPGLVLSIAWTLSTLLTVDKGLSPLSAMTTSNNLTYGKKWTIFFGLLVLGIIMAVIVGILTFIGQQIGAVVMAILMIIGIAVTASFIICGNGFIYQALAGDVPENE
jgi:hypothetical protein